MYTLHVKTGSFRSRSQYLAALAALALAAIATLVSVASQPASAVGSSHNYPYSTPFVNGTAIALSVQVSGQPTVTTDVNVALNSLSHDLPADMDIMIIGPTDRRVMLLSDAPNTAFGPCSADTGFINLTFDDAAPSNVPGNTQLVGGYYRPTDFDTGDCSASDPASDSLLPTPTNTTLAAFNGTNPNGTWTLVIADDGSDIGPNSGTLAGGWTLNLQSENPLATTCNGVPATIVGTAGADRLAGTKKRDVIVGNGGDDQIIGQKGNDLLCGGDGNDTLIGGKGNDQLLGDGGTDTCNGGAGKDTAVAGCEVQRKIP
jgi:Ca2+-binding RTX toxin-like protein